MGSEHIALEPLTVSEYLALYRRVGESVRWDQRLKMPEQELAALLNSGCLKIYVVRDARGEALGFCEFDRSAFPQIELKNFGLIPAARGRSLGSRLLSLALREEWKSSPSRIWLHTDSWDHPSAVRLYQKVGFHVYAVREETAGPL
jgi:ribosomal protein S18 acetylase RimI-like enzyme